MVVGQSSLISWWDALHPAVVIMLANQVGEERDRVEESFFSLDVIIIVIT